MKQDSRRQFLRTMSLSAGAWATLPLLTRGLDRALALPAAVRTGTIADVDHIVIAVQSGRSFDHYFGALAGVRGFGDPRAIPVPVPTRYGRSVWRQPSGDALVMPFALRTDQTFANMRVAAPPHAFADAQEAWDEGRMGSWLRAGQEQTASYYTEADLPYHFALARAFTLCDAYHGSFQGPRAPNHAFLWSGTHDPLQLGNGPILDDADVGDAHRLYAWTTYCERLQQAGIGWRIYQAEDASRATSLLAAFARYQDPTSELAMRALRARGLDRLREDVRAGNLPQVSWVIPPAADSEHPNSSTPAEGAAHLAQLLDALTENADVWQRTVLFVTYDCHGGFFDHVPPPAPPSYVGNATGTEHKSVEFAGTVSVDLRGEHHLFPPAQAGAEALFRRPYGLGPRVPLLVISPWSKGGWIDAQVFDHTSIIRFIERRFGVEEPNISPWRRLVCGDLTSAFDFARPDDVPAGLPAAAALATQARRLTSSIIPVRPRTADVPTQQVGVRPSRALPYQLSCDAYGGRGFSWVKLSFGNLGKVGAVFHVYDRLHLDRVPRRFTVTPGVSEEDYWHVRDGQTEYDLWVLGPNGFHAHFSGDLREDATLPRVDPSAWIEHDTAHERIDVVLRNTGASPATFMLEYPGGATKRVVPGGDSIVRHTLDFRARGNWYDIRIWVAEDGAFGRRFAGRMETGHHATTDPAMGGPARDV